MDTKLIWTQFFASLVLPAIMALIGLYEEKHPPKNINAFLGYRTTRSRRNPEAWEFANRYFGKTLLRCTLWMVLASVIDLILMLVIKANGNTVASSIVTVHTPYR